ncbi:MAG: hypothetical protein ACREJ6_00020, partial [Candidatus Methylomirabilis sp.]
HILRRLEDSFEPVVAAVRDRLPNQAVLDKMADPKFLRRRLQVFERMDPNGFAAFQGNYLFGFLENAFRPVERVDPTARRALTATLDRLWRGQGKFSRDLFDRVLGRDVRQFFEDLAVVEDRWSKGAAQPINSLTAARVGDAALIGAGIKAPQVLLDVLGEASRGEFKRFGSVAMGSATAIMFYTAIRSLLHEGRLARGLNKLATGQTLTTPTQGAVALQQARRLGEGSRGFIPQVVGGGLSALNLGQPVE